MIKSETNDIKVIKENIARSLHRTAVTILLKWIMQWSQWESLTSSYCQLIHHLRLQADHQLLNHGTESYLYHLLLENNFSLRKKDPNISKQKQFFVFQTSTLQVFLPFIINLESAISFILHVHVFLRLQYFSWKKLGKEHLILGLYLEKIKRTVDKTSVFSDTLLHHFCQLTSTKDIKYVHHYCSCKNHYDIIKSNYLLHQWQVHIQTNEQMNNSCNLVTFVY